MVSVAQHKIEENLRAKKESLDLSNCNLKNESPELQMLKQCTYLKTLTLSDNALTRIEGLQYLVNLEELNLGSNEIRRIENIECLVNLQVLFFGRNKISKIENLETLSNLQKLNLAGNERIRKIENLETLRNLKELFIGYNPVNKIENLENLTNLEHLSLVQTQFTRIENLEGAGKLQRLNLKRNLIRRIENLENLINLRHLILSGNQIHRIENLENLINLRELNLSENRISRIENLENLVNLQELYLSDNQVRRIEGLENLLRLQTLTLEANPINSISYSFLEKNNLQFEFDGSYTNKGILINSLELDDPPTDVLKQGKEFALEYIRDKNKKPLNECKVILVGNGSVGKTSLQKRIFNDKDFNKDEKETHGIRKECWENGVKTADGKPIKVNFWDFGGQHIQQTLHQFFYTENTIYILVLDKRKDESPEEFLELIKAYGANSPVIVVYNNAKKDKDSDEVLEYDLHPSLDSTILNKYPNIRTVIGLCCAQEKDKGVAELRKYLKAYIPTLDHVNEKYPPEWLKVKDDLLEEVKNNYIKYDKYETLCEGNKVNRPEIQKGLAKMLNNVGTITFFDKKFIGGYFILNPDWLTTGAYEIILSQRTSNKKGRIKYNDLDAIFKKPKLGYSYKRDEYEFLLQLMKEFDLCHEFSEDEWLIPSSLEGQSKTNLVEYRQQQTRLYALEFSVSLPASIIHRFVARNIPFAYNEDYWKNGIVVKHPGSETLMFVEADSNDKEIRLWIKGEKIRDCWEFFRKDLREFCEKFDCEEVIYINFDNKIKVAYSDLLDAEKAGKKEVYIFKYGDINVKDTLSLFEKPQRELEVKYLRKGEQLQATIVKKIAISYSKKDISYAKKLKDTWLKAEERAGRIKVWFDQEINPGDVWEEVIQDKLSSADIILLIISEDFIASDFINGKELPLIAELYSSGQAKVLPIIARTSSWARTPWAAIQAIPLLNGKIKPISAWTKAPNDKDAAWLQVQTAIKALLDE